MLSKLLKYEFKATCRIYGGLYLAILAAAALLGAFFRFPALAAQYDVTYVPIPYTRTANDGHPTVSGHKYIGRQILKAVNY